MRLIILFICISLITIKSGLSQGTNNDFDYTREDLDFIFSEIGYSTFKFPIIQEKGEVLDFEIEEYRDGKLLKTISLIEASKISLKEIGLDAMSYIRPKMDSIQNDSIYFHKFYFHKTNTLLKLNIRTHGLVKRIEFDVPKSIGISRARYKTKKEIDKQGYLKIDKEKTLIFFYANKHKDETLWCPSGFPKQKIIDNFYYSVFIKVKRYKRK